MAIYHMSMKPVSRSSGRSAVASAAYRAAERLINERDGLVHDFTRRDGVEHTEILLPAGVEAKWAEKRSALWNAAERAEKRSDARVAREIEVALPHELTPAQRLGLTREYAQGLADRYGVAVDFAIHTPQAESNIMNHHAHIMMTTRKVADRLGEKSELELENRKLLAMGLPATNAQLRDLRIGWEQMTNTHLAKGGLDVRIDHRSHQERGLEIEPTQHMGVHATQMERRGKDVSRLRLDAETSRKNAILIRERPDNVLTLLTHEKSVFDRQDIARALHRYIGGAEEFQNAMAKVMASPALVRLRDEHRGEEARYSSREMVAVERAMADSADRMAGGGGFGVSARHLHAAITGQRPEGFALTAEQSAAVAHIAGPERIAVVVGMAGAGKSTMLAAAREAWQREGFAVHGAALAGKAAEGLAEASGIPSRTLASWERGWDRGFDRLGPKDVFVIDESGMVGSKQLARFITEADKAGAKIVLVGDPEQLQPIGAGAAFRVVAERVGFADLEEIRRQREEWMREASAHFGKLRTTEGIAAYDRHGAVRFAENSKHARDAIVRDVLADMDTRPDGSRLVMAHRRVDVRDLNEAIRAARQERGELAGERVYQTAEGERSFAPGDRLMFRENNRDLAVKNGMLGSVERAEEGRLAIKLDSTTKGPGQGREVSISLADYAAVDHGYAATIHKAQGATVDRAFVLASPTMDRHLAYVSMTRHRDGVLLYAGREEFHDIDALDARLSRSSAKETTLDYDSDAFAQRRGIGQRDTGIQGMESEIVIPEAIRERQVRELMREQPAHQKPAATREADRLPNPQTERQVAALVPKAEIDRLVTTAAREQAQSAITPPAHARGMFDGLKLNTGPSRSRDQPEAERQIPADERQKQLAGDRKAEERAATAHQEREARKPGDAQSRFEVTPELNQAVDRFARTYADIARITEQGLPALEHQKLSFKDATDKLNAVRPDAARDLLSAMENNPALERAMGELQGRERTIQLVQGLRDEHRIRQDPNLRALRLVSVWNKLEKEHERTEDFGQRNAGVRQSLEARMKNVARDLKRDPQAEAILRSRAKEFGIEPGSRLARVMNERDTGRALTESLRLSQGQGLSR